MERKRCRLAEEELRAGTESAITDYGFYLSQVTSFKYLGRVLAAEDKNLPALVHNLRRAIQKWAWMTRILIREGADYRTLGSIYLVVVQSVMLYRSEIWFLTPRIKRVIDRFHHRVASRMMGRQPRKLWDGGWVYPAL